MSWPKSESKRSIPCNGALVQKLRKELGWSQKVLAKKSGYSDRWISKAESSGNVTLAALQILAQTLSTKDRPVSAADLMVDHVGVAKSFTRAFHVDQENLVDRIAEFVTDDCVFRIVGDPKVQPHAGVHRGLAEFQVAIKLFFQRLEIADQTKFEECYEYFELQNDVVVWGESWFYPKGLPSSAPVGITQRLQFRDGKICSFEERLMTLARV